MKHLNLILLSAMSLTTWSSSAHDFTVLTTPDDVYSHSIEAVAGARNTFKAVLDDAESTDADKAAAMQTYQQNATPAPGYAFDMTYLMSYTAITPANIGKYTQANLAGAWQNDIDGLTFGSGSVLAAGQNSDKTQAWMRVNSNLLKEADSYNKFAAYQNVTLSKGSYVLESEAYVAGAARTANLAAGDLAVSDNIIGGGKMSDYSVSFKITDTQEIKLGYLRNSTAGGLTTIYFNNIELYKLSNIIAITDDATEGLTETTDADVQLCRTFEEGKYTPLCLPFIIENWRDIFDDLLIWSSYSDGDLIFNTLQGANTQARKPYLAKPKADIDADNYLTFYGVAVQKGNAGSWDKKVAEGEAPYPVKMQGNWAAGTVPANCYYLKDNEWILSDGTAPLPAFSAYIDATGLTEHPSTLVLNNGSITSSHIDSLIDPEAPAAVNVYNLQGIMLKSNAAPATALEDLPAGLYIVNGKKIRKI